MVGDTSPAFRVEAWLIAQGHTLESIRTLPLPHIQLISHWLEQAQLGPFIPARMHSINLTKDHSYAEVFRDEYRQRFGQSQLDLELEERELEKWKRGWSK